MFGERDSESPLSESPWDSLMYTECFYSADVVTSGIESLHGAMSSPVVSEEVFPKLAPEVEQGNVEYKLRLLSPSETRFARLVTQLKWRLLEGGGHAFYELGVADSGVLVGLSRAHLAASLSTLEEMAAEIGARVVVVKEIEIPPPLRMAKEGEFVNRLGCASENDEAELVMELGGRDKKDKENQNAAVQTGRNGGKSKTDVTVYSVGGAMRLSKLRIEEVELQKECLSDSSGATSFETKFTAQRLIAAGLDSVRGADASDQGTSKGMVCIEIARVYKPRPLRRRTRTSSPSSVSVSQLPQCDGPAASASECELIKDPPTERMLLESELGDPIAVNSEHVGDTTGASPREQSHLSKYAYPNKRARRRLARSALAGSSTVGDSTVVANGASAVATSPDIPSPIADLECGASLLSLGRDDEDRGIEHFDLRSGASPEVKVLTSPLSTSPPDLVQTSVSTSSSNLNIAIQVEDAPFSHFSSSPRLSLVTLPATHDEEAVVDAPDGEVDALCFYDQEPEELCMVSSDDSMKHGVLVASDPKEKRYIVEALVIREPVENEAEAFLDFSCL